MKLSEVNSTEIRPWRLNNLIKTSAKVYELVIKSDVGITYEECIIILETVRDMIVKAMNNGKEVKPKK